MSASTPRRATFRLLAATAIALVAGATSSFAAQTLNVLNWKDWGTDAPWALKLFEGPNSIKVTHDYFSSFAEAFTKLRTNPGHYDMLDLNVAFTRQAADEGLIQPIDTSKLKNFASLEENFRNSAEITPGTFCISQLNSSTSLISSTLPQDSSGASTTAVSQSRPTSNFSAMARESTL